MAWVPIHESGVPHSFYAYDPATVTVVGSVVTGEGLSGSTCDWRVRLPDAGEQDLAQMRITSLGYVADSAWSDPAQFEYRPDPNNTSYIYNAGVWGVDEVFIPSPLDLTVSGDSPVIFSSCTGGEGGNPVEALSFLVEIWVDDPEPPSGPGFKVYELDKGWSFDGAYIPHFLEMNWYFGDDPFTDKTIQKVRIHGLSKGLAQLQLSVAGMQHDYDSDFTEPQFINIPRNAAHISEEYIPVTNYVDSSNWGVSHQLRFEGSNTDLSKPEPSHVLQVLALQGSPQDNGKRIN